MAVSSRFVPAPDHVGVRRALVSVFDKDGLFELGEALARRNVEIVSTGGSARALAQADVPVTDVSAVTRFPEIMDGRVKTLHPAIHGGLLGIRGEAGHGGEMSEHGIEAIDLLIVNLYPFETVRREGADYPTSVENIDIGGPAMIRAAAKNHAYVAVVTDPDDYPALIGELDAHDGAISYAFRQRLAAKAFARTAAYDAAIAGWFEDTLTPDEEAAPPRHRTIGGSLRQAMRYGENPHQAAGFYTTGDTRPGVATARQLQGKQLSYNNINDTDAAFECVAEFDPSESPACVIVKHANPCGAALGTSVLDAYEKALACDPVSAFGGIVALNRPLDADAARKIVEIFTEVIIAPDASPEAIGIVAGKKNLRLLLTDGLPDPHAPGLAAKTVAGGVLVQARDAGAVEASSLKTVTTRAPEAGEEADLVFAFRIAKHVKSNAIVYVKDRATVGIGAGQMSRVDAAAIAARKAEDAARAMGLDRPLTRGCVVASDAFFPFADGLLSAIEAGATAVIQPGGSVRDDEVIAAADEAGVAMVFTGMRHFRH